MGYDLFVTRREDWSDEGDPKITLIDWMDYLAIDKSLEIDRERAEIIDPRVAAHQKEPTHTRWLDWPGREPGVREAWMWLEQGNIVASDPDRAFRCKLFLIADGMGGHLMGEDGEIYNSVGDPEKAARRVVGSSSSRRWWKIW